MTFEDWWEQEMKSAISDKGAFSAVELYLVSREAWRERGRHQWQPIETAPLFERVIVCCENGAVGEAINRTILPFVKRWVWKGDEEKMNQVPKLWMPLPEATEVLK